MHAKYEVSISYGSKVIAKVKVDNRQTNKQTDRTKTICPYHSIWVHNKCNVKLICVKKIMSKGLQLNSLSLSNMGHFPLCTFFS